MSKIIYFHGYGSSGATGTAENLRLLLPGHEVFSPDIPVDPSDALPYLRALCEAENPDLIIGTSMGGMYAQQMHGYRKICVNPAFNMSQASKVLKTGTHKFFNRRKDNQTEFVITRDIIRHFNQMERSQFKDITDFDRENTYGLFGIHDTVVLNGYEIFKKHYDKAQRFDGEHRLTEAVLKKVVVPLVHQIFEEL